MIQITLRNSYSQVTGITAKEYKDLRKVLSYDLNPQAKYFSGGSYRPAQSLLTPRGVFPTGVLYLVQEWAKYLQEDVVFKDERVQPNYKEPLEINLKHVPYDVQKEAAEACAKHHRGIIVAPTGVGKSIIAALIVARLAVKTLIVVPSLELKRQLTEAFTALYGASKVGDYAADKFITIDNIDAKYPLNSRFDCLIIDEFHHSAAATYRKLNKKGWDGIYYRFGLTATPFRSQDTERLLLESVLSEVIYRVDYQRSVESGFIVPMEAYFIEVPKKATDGCTWHEVYKDLVTDNAPRNQLIANFMINLHQQRIPTLCLVKEIAHGNELARLTGAAFASGTDTEDCRQLISWFNEGKLTTLIGTTGVLGEGVDTKPAEYVIIAGLGKSKPAFMQMAGRGFRRHGSKDSCKVILFKDNSHKWTKAHFKAQCEVLACEYNQKPVRLEL